MLLKSNYSTLGLAGNKTDAKYQQKDLGSWRQTHIYDSAQPPSVLHINRRVYYRCVESSLEVIGSKVALKLESMNSEGFPAFFFTPVF